MKVGCRSRKGAWIEIPNANGKYELSNVAPVRERGLKYALDELVLQASAGRSRKGAWIEIFQMLAGEYFFERRSRKGAWIEIFVNAINLL